MTKFLRVSAALAAATMMTAVQAAAGDGVIDLGKFMPSPGAQFVEVNINSNLIAMVTNFAKKAEPEVAEILQGLKSIRVNVLGLNEDNRTEIQERITQVRSQLDKSGWDRVVTVIDKADDVGVYIKTKGAEVVEGVVVTVLSGKNEAVFVNIVGDIRPDRLAMVGERFNIEPLKHLPKPAAKNDE
jgi:translation elongation factor EF-Ts